MPTASEDTAIQFSRVTKRFHLRETTSLKEFLPSVLRWRRDAPAFLALDDVSFELRQGETLGVIGKNGSGKSTILKLIAGVMEPTEGQVLTRGRICPLIELGAGFHPDLTGRENVFLNASLLGIPRRGIHERFGDIVAFAELAAFMDMPVKRYSSGMYLRLAFAVAVHCEPDILLVDEALAVGDAQFQEKCLEKMAEVKDAGVTVVLVSHSLPLVESFTSRTILLHRGKLIADGSPDVAIQAYREVALGEPALRV